MQTFIPVPYGKDYRKLTGGEWYMGAALGGMMRWGGREEPWQEKGLPGLGRRWGCERCLLRAEC